MKTECLECGSPIIGRSDKKFCSDQCRYLFNNRGKVEKQKIIIDINSKLRRNRSILKKYSPLGKTTVRKDVFVSENFNFNFHTHIYKTKSGTTYFFCYEYGYTLLPDEKLLIVNWQPYMEKVCK